MDYKILNTIGEVFSKEARKMLEEVGEVDYLSCTQSELKEKIGDYDALFVGLGLNVGKTVIDNAKKLKLIATATTGLDHIDVDYARANEVEVISLKGETKFLNAITGTAELAFGLLLDLTRNISVGFESVKNYEWDRERFRGHNLSGKILGIVGYGRLGRMMARYGQAFGMQVLAYDPYVSDFASEVEQVNFGGLLKKSDAISIHVPLNEETKNIFDKKVFAKMKPCCFLINTSRGKIIDEKDLLEALENKQIAGYAADVLADELSFGKTFSEHPLVEYTKRHNNCIITPHLGGMTHESREATDVFIANKILSFLRKK